MEKIKLTLDYLLFNSIDELSKEDCQLMQLAAKARENAYAPYSNFKVGAAILMANGKVVIGNNQENASYPSGLCAERVAIFQAGAIYPEIDIKAIAVCGMSLDNVVDEPVTSCGNCRQSMVEYEQKQKKAIPIIMMGEKGKVIKCESITNLLPLVFDSSFL